MTRIVGLCGLAGAGKTTAAKALMRDGFRRHRFAGPLKRMLKQIGLTKAQIEGSLKEAPCILLGGSSPRWAMQTLGVEWGRHCMGPEFWVELWNHNRPEGDIVVDDVRFDNEVRMIQRLGGIVIKVVRPTDSEPMDHPSEVVPKGFDHMLVNDGTKGALRGRVRAILSEDAARYDDP